MAPDIHNAFEVLRGSVTEGRAENVRYRQNELYSLHSALRENAEIICEAIAKDYASSRAKAETEFFLTMDAVRISYEKLDFDKSLEDEYSVKFGKDNSKRRAAFGLVHIRPATHSRFYSVVTPLVAALEAGNCIVVELNQSSPEVDRVLLDILPKALDRDTFQTSKDKVGVEFSSQADFSVDQHVSEFSSHTNSSHPPSQGRTVCIVDRTGDLELAIRTITPTRSSSDYTSPYSPDLVIVNEYLKDTFIARCLDFADQFEHSYPGKVATSEELEFQTLFRHAETEGEIVTHKRKSGFTIVELKSRSLKLATKKIAGPYLLLSPAAGIVDSVTSQRSLPTLLASYIFAAPSAAKFVAEQISSHATYINQIPPQLLIGPPSPANHSHVIHPRFTSDMFSTPQPQFINAPTSLPPASKLMKLALKQLKPTGQRPGHAIGFFEQGILLGLGSTALVVLPLVGWGVFRVVKFGMRYI
ncbi:aldehyde dehydrogenase-like protein PutA [Stipitochalara longipes BDJ]|nr:aldehyde dehydrogenase-like protein PutA [Stipitochalara longipes BDJ]